LATNFVCIMNHNGADADMKFRVAHSTSAIAEGGGNDVTSPTEVFNADVSGVYMTPDTNGDSLITFTASNDRYWLIEFEDVATWDENLTVGEIVLGQYYTMPISPDVTITKGTDFEGVQVRKSYGGKAFGSAGYVAPSTDTYTPFRWGTGALGRQMGGRESYNMNFSYINDTDIYSSDRGTIVTNTESSYLFSVANKSALELIPFVFTPDSTSTTIGDYLWSRFQGLSFETSRIANNVDTFSASIVQEF